MAAVETEQEMVTVWQNLTDGKKDWLYSDFYMFNKENQFLTAAGRSGTATVLQGSLREYFRKNGP